MHERWRTRWAAYAVVLPFGWAIVGLAGYAGAACAVEASTSGNNGGLVVHLPLSCTLAEREVRAVSSEAIMDAIAKGRPVDLIGVIVRGDMIFDALTVQTNQPTRGLPSGRQAASGELGGGEVRKVSAAITIRDSVVSGTVRHRSDTGTLRFEGPVDLRGTMFKTGVDLSRSVFQDGVELSGATFEKEVYFVRGRFVQDLKCNETTFGPHTRFHRSIFHGSVECAGALFDGMAEFLEVTFERPVTFERARFGLGTGFSGSLFKRPVHFDEAIFSRETFFGFSVFEADTSFAGAQFLGSVDFSDAEFKKPDNLAQARFDQPPLLTRTTRVVPDQPTEFLKSPAGQYSVTLFLLLMAAGLVAYAIKMK